MTPELKENYIKYRIENAQETIKEAELLFSGALYKGAVNRIYYAIFYTVNALALSDGFTTTKHSQLRGYFNREYVKTGKLDKKWGEIYGAAYDLRTRCDYDDNVHFQKEEVENLLNGAKDFCLAVKSLIESKK